MEEALASDCSEEWKQAADAEYTSLLQNETWDLVVLPSGNKPLEASGSSRSSMEVTGRWNGSKLG